jgi:hypothetical protein
VGLTGPRRARAAREHIAFEETAVWALIPAGCRSRRGLRIHMRVAGSKATLEDGAGNLIDYRLRALPGKEKSMYIGIGTVVLIIIIVLVVLMLRRR